ncbi:MAG: P-II family nitrogen regulator [Lachnospiraceae bacterium]|nr:P-II family nitrogen regulator [Lachnospiraceae bacterium]
MKRLIIVTRKEKLDDIKNLFRDKYFCGMTVSDVVGIGNQSDYMDDEGVRLDKKGNIDVHLISKVRIETVVMDDQVEPLIEDVCETAYTGRYGDGKIFVEDVIDAVRIRTRERGEDALSTAYRH